MIVVADSSPIIVLIDIEHVEVLHKLFKQVVIPSEVLTELRQFQRSWTVQEFITSCPAWLLERTPATTEAIPGLHAGEAAAIGLAQELKADLLLIDDLCGRRAAAERHITFTGTIGVLELAADRGLLDLHDAFERVKTTDFWISHELLDERLRLHLNRIKPR